MPQVDVDPELRNSDASCVGPPEAALFQLHRQVPVTRTLPLGEQARRGLMGAARRDLGANALPPQISGHGPDGPPRLGHAHLHHLPLDLNGDGQLDHLLVFARAGFGATTRGVLQGWSWFVHQRQRIELRRCALGALDEVGPWRSSRHLISTTPFVPPRHPKLQDGCPCPILAPHRVL